MKRWNSESIILGLHQYEMLRKEAGYAVVHRIGGCGIFSDKEPVGIVRSKERKFLRCGKVQLLTSHRAAKEIREF